MIKKLMQCVKKIQILFWPEICPFCGRVSRKGVCAACKRKEQELLVREPRCMCCGKPIRYHEQEYCRDCAGQKHFYDRGVSLWLHKPPVSTSIYQFKYHNQRQSAAYYAMRAEEEYAAVIRKWKPQLIIPIPLHAKRQRKRGYNQAELFAEELGQRLKLPVETGFLRRIKETNPQKKLGHSERKRNLQQAFVTEGGISPRMKGQMRILLVDDIYTTGNTIDAAAAVLKAAGAQKVYFLTISIGQGY